MLFALSPVNSTNTSALPNQRFISESRSHQELHEHWRIVLACSLGGENAMRYVLYGVDLSGVARAVYEIDSPNDEAAKERAEKLLDAHPAVEVWNGPRRIVRLARETSG